MSKVKKYTNYFFLLICFIVRVFEKGALLAQEAISAAAAADRLMIAKCACIIEENIKRGIINMLHKGKQTHKIEKSAGRSLYNTAIPRRHASIAIAAYLCYRIAMRVPRRGTEEFFRLAIPSNTPLYAQKTRQLILDAPFPPGRKHNLV